MSFASTLNATHSLSNTGNPKQKSQASFFNKMDALASELKEVQAALHDLQQQTSNIREEKTNVKKYLEKKSEENRLRLMGELQLFENQVKRRIQDARRQTQKIDQGIQKMKQSQLYSLQMILSIQRRVHELEVQLGTQQTQ